MRCVACSNELRIVGGKCAACRTNESEAKGKTKRPTYNQVSEMEDEPVMMCIACGSYSIHFCYKNQSLRCRKCNRLMTYDEAVSWQRV